MVTNQNIFNLITEIRLKKKIKTKKQYIFGHKKADTAYLHSHDEMLLFIE